MVMETGVTTVEIANAFASGSGVQASTMKVTLTLMAVALAITFFSWVLSVLFDNYREGQLKQEEVFTATIKLFLLLCFLVWVLV